MDVSFQICAASNKVHTTTKLTRALCYENDTQIVFLDTPGIVTVKEQKKLVPIFIQLSNNYNYSRNTFMHY